MIFLPSYYCFGFPGLPEPLDHICYNPIDHYWFMSKCKARASIYAGIHKLFDTEDVLPNPPISPKETGEQLIMYIKDYVLLAKAGLHHIKPWCPELTEEELDQINPNEIRLAEDMTIHGYFLDGTRIHRNCYYMDMNDDTCMDRVPANEFYIYEDQSDKRVVRKDGKDNIWTIHWWGIRYLKDNNPDTHFIDNTDGAWSKESLNFDAERLTKSRICGFRMAATGLMPVRGLKTPGIKTIFIDTDIDELGRFRNQLVCERVFLHASHWFSSIQPNQHDGWGIRVPRKLLSPATWQNSQRIIDYLFGSGEI